jgi:hypothetical protein
MSARLTGSDFSILALTAEEQAVTQVTDTFWKWKITPQKWGDQVLHLSIDIIIDIKGKPIHKTISSFDTKIKIVITPMGKIKYIWHTYWLLICTTILIPAAGYLLKQYLDAVKTKKADNHDDDTD